MAATGGEAVSGDHIGSESLWIPRGGQRKRKDKRRKDEGRRREPRDSRANLNGGELNGEGLKYPKGVSKLRQIKQRSVHVPDRPKWRRTETWAGSRGIGGCSKPEPT